MKRYVLSVIVLAIAIVVPFLLIQVDDTAISDEERITRAMLNEALARAIYTAERHYYKPVDSDEMYRGAIKGALASLGDPYTYYVPPREQRRAVENLYDAEFGGLGVKIYEDHQGFIKISKPMPNTPAQAAGLQAGDYITEVNGKKIHLNERTGLTINDVVDLLRGKKGTDVTITVQREFRDPFEVTLKRATIKSESVISTMLADQIGYIRLREFGGTNRNEGTSKDFTDALLKHRAAGMKALILDLRNNQGGILSAAFYVADAFISEGTIVSTRGRESRFNEDYKATSETLCDPQMPLVVLINEYSASASEIVAGAVKDTNRGILIGAKTYGKGVVQKRYPLEAVGAMSLTISTYFTPNGTSIEQTGITPHIAIAPHKTDELELTMQGIAEKRNAVENFVTKWIVDEMKRTGETPKDFTLLQAELPELNEMLAKDGILVSKRWLKLRAEQLFNLNVGIEKVVNLEYDTQLQEAIRVIKAGEFEKYLTQHDKPPILTDEIVPPVKLPQAAGE